MLHSSSGIHNTGERPREASPRVAHAQQRCAGVCSLRRGSLTARHADCARLVDQSGKKGWKSLTAHSAARFTRDRSGRTRLGPDRCHESERGPLSFLGCRIAADPCRSQSRLASKMGVKWPKKGAKWRLLREHATLLFMTQLLCCHAVALILVEKSAERQIATTIYSLRTCVQNLVSQISRKPKNVAFRSM